MSQRNKFSSMHTILLEHREYLLISLENIFLVNWSLRVSSTLKLKSPTVVAVACFNPDPSAQEVIFEY